MSDTYCLCCSEQVTPENMAPLHRKCWEDSAHRRADMVGALVQQRTRYLTTLRDLLLPQYVSLWSGTLVGLYLPGHHDPQTVADAANEHPDCDRVLTIESIEQQSDRTIAWLDGRPAYEHERAEEASK